MEVLLASGLHRSNQLWISTGGWGRGGGRGDILRKSPYHHWNCHFHTFNFHW